MARTCSTILDAGDLFPTLTFRLTDGSELDAPTGFRQPWNVVLFNRGHWCPFCIAQIKSFQAGLDKLAAEGIGVLSASADTLEKAMETQVATGATFPIAYGLPVKETAAAIGAFYAPEPAHVPPHLQSTGFVLAPDRRIAVSVYSSGAIGRLVWQDVLGLVRYAKSASK